MDKKFEEFAGCVLPSLGMTIERIWDAQGTVPAVMAKTAVGKQRLNRIEKRRSGEGE